MTTKSKSNTDNGDESQVATTSDVAEAPAEQERKGVEVPNPYNEGTKITVDESIKHLFTGEDPPEEDA